MTFANVALDAVLILVFVAIALIGYLRGFAKSVWNTVSLAVSVFLAWKFGPSLGKSLFLQLWKDVREEEEVSELLANICGYLLIFAVSSVLLFFLGVLVKKAARLGPLAHLDSFLGLLLGILCGLLTVTVICVLFSLVIELKLSGDETEMLTSIAENSVIFRFFCQFTPFQYIHITDLFS